jgi:hypothetical protein
MKAQFRPEDLVGQYAIRGLVSVIYVWHEGVCVCGGGGERARGEGKVQESGVLDFAQAISKL